MTLFRPERLDEALALMAAEGPAILAGGTDFYPALRDRPPPDKVLDLGRVAELSGITRAGGEIRIGAGVTWSALIAHDLPPAFDALKAAGRTVGSVQIQNAATVAGNLCNASPAADGVPPLLVLEAEVEIAGPSGNRRLALSDFITGVRRTALAPGEIVTAIRVPEPAAAARSRFSKLGARSHLVISIAMTAVLLQIEGDRIARARIAVGACSPVARRLPALEAALEGRTAAEAACVPIVDSHLAPLAPISDIRGSAEYRRTAVREMLARDIAALCGERADA
ncbi:MAG: xanthine dehydrogenase family protein subunit M [Alphaproteobacteria bacterium]|nr:MAG: xanthine dehydrogenase family protein subunit M [Alphaproteobacteria bacterium]